jgi:AcrR family transcriptional regulator
MVTTIRKKKDAERRARTRRALLDASKVVLARQGFHRTLVSDIVAEAGTGQGTFYRNFENKRQMLEVLFDEFVQGLLAEFSDMSMHLPTNVQEYRDASTTAVIRATQLVLAQKDLARLFLREGPSIDREFEQRIRQIGDGFGMLAQTYLEHAIAQGFARRCNPHLVAQSIVGMGMWHLDRWLGGPTEDVDVEATVDELVDFAFWGFGPPEEKRP